MRVCSFGNYAIYQILLADEVHNSFHMLELLERLELTPQCAWECWIELDFELKYFSTLGKNSGGGKKPKTEGPHLSSKSPFSERADAGDFTLVFCR